MKAAQVLAFSSSRVGDGAYLKEAVPVVNGFLGAKEHNIGFVPFASVDSYEDYAEKVSSAFASLPYTFNTVNHTNAKEVIETADVIMIGGGNTFKLLHHLYAANVVSLIKERVQSGTPYVGWSAGSNLTGPTICTTNDMPIIEPESFAAFSFFPFQINPHYHNIVIEGFNGETRDQRLEEFLKVNESRKIMCLPEGTYLKLQQDELIFDGIAQGVLMTREEGQTIHRIIHPGTMLDELIG